MIVLNLVIYQNHVCVLGAIINDSYIDFYLNIPLVSLFLVFVWTFIYVFILFKQVV